MLNVNLSFQLECYKTCKASNMADTFKEIKLNANKCKQC